MLINTGVINMKHLWFYKESIYISANDSLTVLIVGKRLVNLNGIVEWK